MFSLFFARFSVNFPDELSRNNHVKPFLKGLNPPINPFKERNQPPSTLPSTGRRQPPWSENSPPCRVDPGVTVPRAPKLGPWSSASQALQGF